MKNDKLIEALEKCAASKTNCSEGEFPAYCLEVCEERNSQNMDCIEKLMVDAIKALKENNSYKNWTYVLFEASNPDVESIQCVTRDLNYALNLCVLNPYLSMVIWFDEKNSSETFTVYNAYHLLNCFINSPIEREFIIECRKTLDPYVEKYFKEQNEFEEKMCNKKEQEERKLLAELKAKYEKD